MNNKPEFKLNLTLEERMNIVDEYYVPFYSYNDDAFSRVLEECDIYVHKFLWCDTKCFCNITKTFVDDTFYDCLNNPAVTYEKIARLALKHVLNHSNNIHYKNNCSYIQHLLIDADNYCQECIKLMTLDENENLNCEKYKEYCQTHDTHCNCNHKLETINENENECYICRKVLNEKYAYN